MKRILIISDTHGDINDCVKIIEKTTPDMIIHAGDIIRDADDLISIYPDIPMHCVCGNNDFSKRYPYNLLLSVDGKNIFITHGHEYCVKYESSLSTLEKKAREMDADLCVFGHTHTPLCAVRGTLIMLNPGSTRFSGTYAICEIENGKMKTCILDV